MGSYLLKEKRKRKKHQNNDLSGEDVVERLECTWNRLK